MKNRIMRNNNCLLFLITIPCIVSGLYFAKYDIGTCLCIIGIMSFLVCLCMKAKRYRKRKDAEAAM